MEGLPRLPAETVREINGMAAIVDEAKLAAAISVTDSPPAAVQAYAPMSERAPDLVAASIRKSSEDTAKELEAAAEAIRLEAEEASLHARQTAQAIREYGNAEADAAFATLSMIREQSRIFKEQGERIQQRMTGAANV